MGQFLRMGLARQFLVYGVGILLVAFVVLLAVQHLVFGLSEEFLWWHLLYVAGFTLLVLGPLGWLLRRAILRPLARLVEANRQAAAGHEAGMFIPREDIPPGELGEVMRTRNEVLGEMRRREAEVLRRNRELSVLYTIDRAAAQSLDLEKILNDAVEATLEVLEIEAGGILLLEPDGETMTLRVHRGLSEELVRNVQRTKLWEGVSGRAAAEKKPVVLA